MLPANWIHLTILNCVLLSDFLTLVTTEFHQFDGSFSKHPSGRHFRYPGASLKSQSKIPIDFPSYFVDSQGEIPKRRFGFDVVYGSSKESTPVTRTYPKFRSNSKYSFPDHSDFEEDSKTFFHQNYYPKYSSGSRDGFFNAQSLSNPLSTVYDDWSPGQKNSESYPSKRNLGKSTFRATKSISNNNHRRNPQHYSVSNLEKSKYQKLRPALKKPVKGRSFSSQQSYRPSIPSTYGAPNYRDYRIQPQRKSSSKRFNKPFRPSPPDVYLNSMQNYEHYLADSSETVSTFIREKKQNNTTKLKKSNCTNLNKTLEINGRSNKQAKCYRCVDERTGMSFERCSPHEKVLNSNSTSKSINERNSRLKTHSREKRHSNEQPRTKRQYDDYEGDDRSYEDDEKTYRFGPEHFVDPGTNSEEVESSYESGDPDEKCLKRKDGDQLCITCEKSNSGGTYRQCSYASDPYRVSYDRSVSTEYGGSADSEENDSRDHYDDADSYPPFNLPQSPPALPYSSSPVSHHGGVYRPQAAPLKKVTKNLEPASPRSHRGTTNSRHEPTPSSNPPQFVLPASTFNFGDHFHRIGNYEDPFSHIFTDIGNSPVLTDDFHEDIHDHGEDDFPSSFGDEEGQFVVNDNAKVRRNPSGVELNKTNENRTVNRKLDGFSNENKTACKKTIKNELTCYMCVNENGVKREKCSNTVKPSLSKKDRTQNKYSQPYSTTGNDKTVSKKTDTRFLSSGNRDAQHVGDNRKYDKYYGNKPTEIKYNIRLPRNSDNEVNVSRFDDNSNSIIKTHDQFSKESIHSNATVSDEDVPSSEQESEEDEDYATESYHSVTTEPPEVEEIPNEEGEFSKGTEMMFEPTLGISLPQYMVV